MLELTGVTKHHAWGGKHFFPLTFGFNDSQGPISEYIVDDSISHSARLADGSLLCDWIERNPDLTLSAAMCTQFNKYLPFSLVIRDVNQPINAIGHGDVPTNNHSLNGSHLELFGYSKKRRIVYSLSGLYMLHGYKSENIIVNELSRIDALAPYTDIIIDHGLEALMRHVDSLESSVTLQLIESVVDQFYSEYQHQELSKSDSIYWFMNVVLRERELGYPLNRYLLMLLVLNVVHVPKHEAIFVDSHIVFGFLEGQHIEVSSKVIPSPMMFGRNILVNGLLEAHDKRNFGIAPSFPNMMQPDVSDSGERYFCDIGEDIKLGHISLKAGQSLQILPSNNAAVWLQYCGELKIDAQPHFSRAGHTFYQRANQFATLFAMSDVTLYKASSNLPSTN